MQNNDTALALAAAASKPDGGWAGDVQNGLYLILGSRVGQQQRHSALRLAAAVLALVQSDWLLGPVSAVSLSPSLQHLFSSLVILPCIWLLQC